jgi:DNA polymerase-4
MGLMKAAALAPDAILLPADFEQYHRYSRRFKAAVAEIAPHIEDRGIDEIYIDLTNAPGETVPLAQRIKDNVLRATGLSCSIGVSPNKLLAKIASDLDKPDGLTILTYTDLPARVWPLAVRKINGIGPKAGLKLEALGIRTIGELAHASADTLVEHFGKHYGRWLVEAANGQDDRPVVTESEPKSVSRETTFERDLDPRRDRDTLSRIFVALCEGLSEDLQQMGYLGRTIGVKLRYDDFRTLTRAKTLATPIDQIQAILNTARDCLKRVSLDRKLRLLGVRASSLVRPGDDVDASPVMERTNESATGKTLRLFE